MKKTILIIIVVIAVVAILVGAYWFGVRTNGVLNGNTNAEIDTNNSNISPEVPRVTYESFIGKMNGYTFDTIKEWTSVAPQEVEKSITAEQRHGYGIVYYAANTNSVVLAVSEKQATDVAKDFSAAVNDDLATAKTQQPGLTVVNTRVGANDAQTEILLQSASTEYTVFTRYLALPPQNNIARWAMLEVSVPTSKMAIYSSIATHLLDSLRLNSAQVR